MRIFFILVAVIAFSMSCSKTASNADLPAEPVITESQKLIAQMQSFADKSYPGWQVVAQRQDSYLSGAGDPTFYYTVLSKEGEEKVILAAVLEVDFDGLLRAAQRR